ncbi:MAG: MFS transporter [Candidatus Roizmanbacteria bacterium]|nr:MFS transporter [Candidatus Roizmanbacteria bacterium]
MKKEATQINLLHILNDGFKASLILFLPTIAKEFIMSLTQVGFLGSALNSLDIVLAIPASHFASKIGGKKILVGAIFFWALGFILTGVSPYYSFIVIAFIVAGIGFGSFHPVAFALVSKMFEKKVRGKQLGNFSALGELGKVGISSLITFVIVYIGWRNTSVMIGVILLAIGLYFVHLLKKDIRIKDNIEDISPHVSYKSILKNKKFILSTISYCFDTFASGSLFIFIPFLLLQRHVPYIFLGLLTSTFFIGNMAGKVFLGRLVDTFGNTNVFIFSEICMAIFIVILSNAAALPVIIASSVILGVFTKGTSPVLTTMIAESVDHHKGMEKAFGLNAIFVGVASTTAPFVLGFLSDRFGIITAFHFSAGFALVATIPALLLKRT